MDTLAEQRQVHRALVIDGDRSDAFELRSQLATLGLHALLEADVESGLQLARRERPELVMIDAHLPAGPGLEFLPHFKSLPHSPSVIMLSSREDSVDAAMNALRLGAEDWLYRPFDPIELRSAVERALRWASLRKDPATMDQLSNHNIRFEMPELVGLAEMQYRYVELVLERVGGHRGRACEVLGISRPRLRRILASKGVGRITTAAVGN